METYEKYIRSLELYDAVLATKNAVEPEGGWPLREWVTGSVTQSGPLHPCHAAWDTLFSYIYDNFFLPETAMKDGEWPSGVSLHEEVKLVTPIIDGTYSSPSETLEEAIRKIPPVIAEVVWPVAIARLLLRDHRMPFNHRMSDTFTEFHHRYGPMILTC
jgi:hypothetical protein